MVSFHSSIMIIICTQDARFGPSVDHEDPHFRGLKRLNEVPANRFPQNWRQRFPIFESKCINEIKQQDWYIVFPKRCHDAATSQLLSLALIKKIFGFPSVSDKLPQLTLASFQSRCGRVKNTALPRARRSGRRPGCRMSTGSPRRHRRIYGHGNLKSRSSTSRLITTLSEVMFLLLQRKEDFRGEKGKRKKEKCLLHYNDRKFQ